MYLPRQSEKILDRYLTLFPAITITGPRQSGKSTMLKVAISIKPNYFYDEYKVLFCI